MLLMNLDANWMQLRYHLNSTYIPLKFNLDATNMQLRYNLDDLRKLHFNVTLAQLQPQLVLLGCCCNKYKLNHHLRSFERHAVLGQSTELKHPT